MGFRQDGFLAPDITIFVDRTREKFSDWFSLLGSLNAECMKVLWELKPKTDDEQQLVATLLFCRAIQAYQASTLMAERGMIAEARTLVRSCAECAFALGAIALDRSFLGELIDGHFKHTKKTAHAYLEEQELFNRLTPKNILTLHEHLAQIKSEYPEKPPKGLDWKDIAKRVGMTVLYNTVYRDTSSDAVHVTLDALNRHVISDSDANIKSLKFGPDDVELEGTLSIAVSALLHAMNGIVLIWESESIALTQKDFAEKWKNMRLTDLKREEGRE